MKLSLTHAGLLALVLFACAPIGATAQIAPTSQNVGICDPTPYSHSCIIPNADGSMSISGSITTSLAGFTPNGNKLATPLLVTSTTGNVALPSGAVVQVNNTGTGTAYLAFGTSNSVTADLNGMAVPGNSTVYFTVGSNTWVAAITKTPDTASLNINGGSGLGTNFGGGGGSLGSGGAVTIADGADTTLGSKADAKSTATDTTPITAMQVWKEISAMLQAPPSQAVTNAGTFPVQLTGATNNINNISGTISLPTSAATSTAQGNQLTQETASATALGAPADTVCGTSSGTCSIEALVKYFNGQIVTLNGKIDTLNTNVTAAIPAGGNLIGKVGVDQTTPGTTDHVSAVLLAGSALAGKVGIDQTTPGTTDHVSAALLAGTNSIGTTQPGNITSCTGTLPISQATSTDLHTMTNIGNICSIVLVISDAETVSLTEGTGTLCATGAAALLGSTTVGNGMTFAANGGFSGISAMPWLKMGTSADHLCLLQSGTGRLSGVITYSDHT